MPASHESALPMHFSVSLVLLSVVIASLAGYLALDLARRSARSRSPRGRRTWLLVGATTMGLGIWSMHFVAMLALDLHTGVRYRLDLVVVSMLAAVLGAGVALGVITRPGANRRSLLAAAGFMGLAIAAMHYIGMASMEMEAHIAWSLPLVGASLAVAYGASLFALWLVFTLRDGLEVWSLGRRVAATLALGVGVAGLHYTAMAASTFHPATAVHVAGGVHTNQLAALLAIAAGVILVVVLLGAHRDQRSAALAGDLTVIARVMRDIGRSDNARERICAAACELTDAALGALIERDGDERLVLTASSGVTLPPLALSALTSVPAQVLASGERAFVSRTAGHPGVVQEVADATGIESALYEPVIRDDRTVAVLVVGWQRRVNRLSDHAVTLAGLLAAEAAFAIERADLLSRLALLASTDPLTGLPNRRSVDEDLDRLLARSGRSGRPVSVAMLDIDHFKAYNDRYGHLGGDRLLKAAAAAWRVQLRGGDMVGRYGGEEFLVLLPGCALDAAHDAADRLRGALPDGVTCSAGVARWDSAEAACELVARADAALYVAKRGGRDRTALSGV
jgi:diguanylate cyclase (GGDEF)-like protein